MWGGVYVTARRISSICGGESVRGNGMLWAVDGVSVCVCVCVFTCATRAECLVGAVLVGRGGVPVWWCAHAGGWELGRKARARCGMK